MTPAPVDGVARGSLGGAPVEAEPALCVAERGHRRSGPGAAARGRVRRGTTATAPPPPPHSIVSGLAVGSSAIFSNNNPPSARVMRRGLLAVLLVVFALGLKPVCGVGVVWRPPLSKAAQLSA